MPSQKIRSTKKQTSFKSQQKLQQEYIEYSHKVGKIGTFQWNIKTNKSSWSKEFEALYGYPNGKYKGKDLAQWSKMVHPEDRKKVFQEMTMALVDKPEMNIEFRVVWPDKSLHYLTTRAKIIRDKKGKAIYVIGVNIDITDRKNIEYNLEYLSQSSKILSSSLDYNKTLVSVADLGVPEIADWCTVDMLMGDGKIKQLALAHVDPKKIKWAKELNKKSPPRDINSPTGISQVLRTGKSGYYPFISDEILVASARTKKELTLLRKLNLRSCMIVPLNVQNKIIGTITYVASDSGRLYTHSDLTMAEEVAGRAALAIENARLFTESQKAIAIRDEFINIASHELKTPVTSLKMYTQIMHKQFQKTGNEALLAPLSKMNGQLQKLNLLIDDLLNISKIQLGKLEFHLELFDINALIHDIVESIQHNEIKHKITIEGTLKDHVYGDKDRIGQVITNLITNAVKYSPSAQLVTIILKEDKKHTTISIQDYGIGIDKPHLEKIFERFYRVTDPNEKTFPGLGIGLYISSQIIHRHSGTIDVTSTKGKGSTFSFTLPKSTPSKNSHE